MEGSPGENSLSLNGGSSSSSTQDYEVFLSFRGPDTRSTIVDSLYKAMIGEGVRVFKDDEELRAGEEIGGALRRAISNSKIYVIIFSKGYASSKRCRCELTCMVEHWKSGEKVILLIFYDVDASDVKLKTGSYSMALRTDERESGEDAAKQWEEALGEVAGIEGWNLTDHGEIQRHAETSREILREIQREILDQQMREEISSAGDHQTATREIEPEEMNTPGPDEDDPSGTMTPHQDLIRRRNGEIIRPEDILRELILMYIFYYPMAFPAILMFAPNWPNLVLESDESSDESSDEEECSQEFGDWLDRDDLMVENTAAGRIVRPRRSVDMSEQHEEEEETG